MRINKPALFLLIILASPLRAFEMGGYYKNFSMAVNPAGEGELLRGELSNRIRLNFSLGISTRINIKISYDLISMIRGTPGDENYMHNPYAVLEEYRISDLKRTLYPRDKEDASSFSMLHNLDRLVLSVRTKKADLFIGRQALAWGSARVINPTDIIAPFSFNELDTEDRRGVDAVRVRFPVQAMGEIDAGYVCGKNADFPRSAVFTRVKCHYFSTDLSLLALAFRENLLLGIDLTRSIKGAGFWLEAAWASSGAFAEGRSHSSGDYTRITSGWDYNFSGTLYGFAEYHLSTLGASNTRGYFPLLRGEAFREGSVYLLGRNYLASGLAWSITPLISMRVESIWNLEDESFFLTPRLEYSFSEDVYLEGGAFIGLGKSASILPGGYLEARSEFGIYPDVYYTSFRVYF